jgi:hypothetical protein
MGNEYDEIIKPDEVRQILRKPTNTPATKALIDYALENIYGNDPSRMWQAWGWPSAGIPSVGAEMPEPTLPDGDLEQLRLYYAREYYRFIYEAVKAADPNHLYLGFWIVPGWWVNESDWTVSAPFCDVIGYDRYSDQYDDDMLRRLKAQTDKPVFCGEYSFPPLYGGTRGFGRYGVISADDAGAGRKYALNMRAATADPYNTGACWFTWHDQPLTGRGPGRGPQLVIGEHFAFGPVTETDRPKWDMVHAMREANLQAAQWRLEAMEK